jgi:hypothetical protein
MLDRASLRCENLPVTIAGETIYANHEKITAQDLLNRLEKVLTRRIESIREDGYPLEKIADFLVLQDIMFEKDLDRADEMIVYLLARPGCNFDFALYDRLKEIAMALIHNKLTGDQLFRLFSMVSSYRWSDEAQDFVHIDSFKTDDKAEETSHESECNA